MMRFKRGQKVVTNRLPLGATEWVWDVPCTILRYDADASQTYGGEWYIVREDGYPGWDGRPVRFCGSAERLRAA